MYEDVHACMFTCSTYLKTPSDRHKRKISAFECVNVEMIVGAKNMHSSSGCAVIRRTFPSSFSDLFPVILVTRATNKTDMKPIPKLTDHRKVRRAIFHALRNRRSYSASDCTRAYNYYVHKKRKECVITVTLYHMHP